VRSERVRARMIDGGAVRCYAMRGAARMRWRGTVMPPMRGAVTRRVVAKVSRSDARRKRVDVARLR